MGSTPEEGSSKNYILLPPIKANETHSFLLLPPLNYPAGVLTQAVSYMTLRKYSTDSYTQEPLSPFRQAHIVRCQTGVIISQRLSNQGHMPTFWKIAPLPLAISQCCNKIYPVVGLSLQVIILNVVDFPAPFGPNNPKIQPGSIPKEVPFTAE